MKREELVVKLREQERLLTIKQTEILALLESWEAEDVEMGQKLARLRINAPEQAAHLRAQIRGL